MSGSRSDTKSTSRSEYEDATPPEFIDLRDTVAAGIADLIRSGGGRKFKGPFIAPILDEELAQLGYLNELDTLGPDDALVDTLLRDVMQGRYLTPGSNPFIRDYVSAAQEQVREAYDAEEMERRALFAKAGHRLPESSPFAKAQAIAGGEFAEALGDIATEVYFNVYEAERGRQHQAVDQRREIDMQRWARALENLQAQALPRLIEQHGIDAALEEFYRRQQMLMAALGLGGELGQPTLGYNSYGRSTSTTMGGGFLYQGGGGGDTSTSTGGGGSGEGG
jgi:hypothetical protein